MEKFDREGVYVPVESKTILKGLEFALATLGEAIAAPQANLKAKDTIALFFSSDCWWRTKGPFHLRSTIKPKELLLQLAKEADLPKEAPSEADIFNPTLLVTVDGQHLGAGDMYYDLCFEDNKWKFVTEMQRILHKGSNAITHPEISKAFYSKISAEAWMKEQNAPPILTTEDGKPLRSGDLYYCVFKLTNSWDVEDCPSKLEYTDSVVREPVSFKAFYEKEAAEKWIDEQNSILLISEDGVPLKTGDRIYIVNKGDNNVWWYNNRSPYYNISTYNQSLKKDEYKAFSTEEAARKFIREQSVTVEFGNGYNVIVSADSWVFSDLRHTITKFELNKILEIYNTLQPF